MRLCVLRTVSEDGETLWILFWQGEIRKPIAVSTDTEINKLRHEIEEQRE